ncbi:MAG TPA: hypothetical protein VK195_21100 [Burkholderiaceae bacterium]|nr:hypothetical protein [Burkholderiaceae bacterium]
MPSRELLDQGSTFTFETVMDLHLPNWQHVRKQLNRLPVRHETWDH